MNNESNLQDSENSVITFDALEKEDKYKKVGGWLLIFCLSLVVVQPLMAIITMITLIEGIFPSIVLKYFLIDCLIQMAVTLYGVYVGIQLFKLKSNAVSVAKTYLIVSVAVCLISVFLPYVMDVSSYLSADIMAANIRGMIRSVIYFAIWTSYFNKSRRVKITFNL